MSCAGWGAAISGVFTQEMFISTPGHRRTNGDALGQSRAGVRMSQLHLDQLKVRLGTGLNDREHHEPMTLPSPSEV